MLIAYPLSFSALWLVPRARQLVVIPLLFVAIYSILPHKELRFILYAVPPLNVGAAAALAKLLSGLPKESVQRASAGAQLGVWAAYGVVAAAAGGCMLVSLCFLAAAHLNYPGAHALLSLHRVVGPSPARAPRVHIGVDAAMSGVSRFLELPPPWRYSKQEGLHGSDYKRFTHLLTAAGASVPGFSRLYEEDGFKRVSFSYPFLISAPAIGVLKRQPERLSAKAVPDEANDDFSF